MIDFQPTAGHRHCLCRDVSDGFTYSATAETYVHAACGKPRPKVETNLHQLPALVPIATEAALMDQLAERAPNLVAAMQPAALAPEWLPEHPVFPSEPEPPAAQPPRRRGRPPKDTKGLALEKRDAPDRWCVIREATGEIVESGLTSKAKATAAMDDLIRKASETDGSSPAVELPTDQHPTDARGAQFSSGEPATGPAADHLSAGAGQPAGPVAGGVRADLDRTQPAGEDARGAEDLDQGRVGPAVPGAGAGGDQPEPQAAAEVLPAGPGDAGPEHHQEHVPGDLGPVHDGNHQLGAGLALTAEQPYIHGPEGDCPECFRLWDWCPASYAAPSNPPAAETSPATTGQGSLPASVALTSTEPPTLIEDAACLVHGPHGGTVDCPTCLYQVAGEQLVAVAGLSTAPSTPVDNPKISLHTQPDYCVHGQPACAACRTNGNEAYTAITLPGTVIDSSRPSLAAFMSAAKHVAQSGNTPWAAQYANELRQIVIDRAENAPRNLQRHLGPSEIGHRCDRQVVGKLVGFPKTNHVVDPWPSIMGTAGHAWMEETFQGHNTALGWQRWLVEQRVIAHPDHAGTSDLYDAANLCVDDHKFLGETSMAKLRADKVPPQYFFQLLTYRRGYQLMGLRVDRIVIIGWPRTGSSVDGMYVWEHPCTPEDDQQLDALFGRMQWRKQWAAAISAGNAKLMDVPAVPNADDCYMCPFYRPQSARDGGPGCPGHAGV